jgi:MFS family permease
MGKANAWYLACNCAGSLTGPVVMGLVVEHWGWRGLFFATDAAIVLVAIGGTLWARSRPHSMSAISSGEIRPDQERAA